MYFRLDEASLREMGQYVSRLELGAEEEYYDASNTANPSSYGHAHDDSSVCLDNEISDLTRIKSKPNGHLSKINPGKRKRCVPTVAMLAGREANYSGRGRFTSADCCHVASRYVPVKGPWLVDQMSSRAYVSQFSTDGSLFVTGFQVNLRMLRYAVDFSSYWLPATLSGYFQVIICFCSNLVALWLYREVTLEYTMLTRDGKFKRTSWLKACVGQLLTHPFRRINNTL